MSDTSFERIDELSTQIAFGMIDEDGNSWGDIIVEANDGDPEKIQNDLLEWLDAVGLTPEDAEVCLKLAITKCLIMVYFQPIGI